jgi:NTP pyrophosphatase (non-canonical NTP hydrolase)
MSEAELYKKILDKWSLNAQLGMLQEECAELIVAINKLRRGVLNADAMICEEMADVQNMINQLKLLYPDFEKVRLEKLKRMRKLLDIPEVG